MKYSYLLFTIPMVLSVLAGLILTFAVLPYWLFRRRKLTSTRRMIFVFALLGLLIPLMFEAKYELTHTEILSQSMWVWPASIGLMGLDRHATTTEVLVGLGLTTLSNVGLYALIGWIIGISRVRLVGGR